MASNWTFKEDDTKIFRYAADRRGEETEPYEFTDRLIFKGYNRGRSAVTIWWQGECSGKEYPMFISDFEELMNNCELYCGDMVHPAKFTQVKKGQSIGIRILKTSHLKECFYCGFYQNLDNSNCEECNLDKFKKIPINKI